MEGPEEKKALIDEDIFEELKSCMGESFPMVVKAFCESSTKHMKHIKEFISHDDVAYEHIADSAHALKSISSQIGALQMAEISGQIEEIALEASISGGNKRKIRALYDVIAGQLPELYEKLEARL